MTWRLAKSLVTLRGEINDAAPNRSKVSDGTIGDTRHAAGASDHNPNGSGAVTALDITHDPAGGCDSYALARSLVASPDARLKYVISNGKIASRVKGWTWRKYTGKNPHSHHVHISVEASPKLYDDARPWNVAVTGATAPSPVTRHPLLKRGSQGNDVRQLQHFLKIEEDGLFGSRTERAVIAFQKAHKLVPDGIVGPYTWDVIEGLL